MKTIIKQNTSKQTQWTNIIRRVSRYQTANQNPYIEEGETTQLPKEKEHKDKKTIYRNSQRDQVFRNDGLYHL